MEALLPSHRGDLYAMLDEHPASAVLQAIADYLEQGSYLQKQAAILVQDTANKVLALAC